MKISSRAAQRCENLCELLQVRFNRHRSQLMFGEILIC